MAHVKAGGSTANVHDSPGQRLGVKLFGGQKAVAGNIIVRQRGTKFYPGDNVKKGRDDTLYALTSGQIVFSQKRVRGFDGRMRFRRFIHVKPPGKVRKKAKAKN